MKSFSARKPRVALGDKLTRTHARGTAARACSPWIHASTRATFGIYTADVANDAVKR